MNSAAPGAEPSGLKRFFRHSAIYAFGSIINRVGAFLLLPLYTNYLSVAEYGSLELFYTISSIVYGLLSVGIAHATLRFYYEYKTDEDRHALVHTNFVAIFVIGVVGALLVSIWSPEITATFFTPGAYPWGMPLVLASMVFELGSQVCLAYVRAIERSMFFVGIAVAKLLVQVALNAVLVVHFHAGVEGVLLGNLAAVFLGFVVLGVFTIYHCGIGFDTRKMFPVLRYSSPFLLSAALALAAGNIDRVLLSARVSLAALGVYALASKFASLLNELLGEPFNRSYGALRFALMDKPEAAPTQEKITRYFGVGMIAAGLGLVLFTRELLVITSDPQYWDAATYLPLLALVAFFRAMNYPMQTGILYGKHTTQLFYIKLVTTIAAIGLNLALVGPFGIIGVCVAVLIASALEMVITDYWSQKVFPVRYHWWRMGVAGALAAVFYAASLPLDQLSLAWSIPLKAALWLLFAIAVLFSPALRREEAQSLLKMAQSLLSRRARALSS
jgi:O-antigen/teichoic acid export membrane protein